MNENTDRGAAGRLAGIVGIAANAVLFAMKLVVGTLAGSVSITADALNNLSDAGSSVVTLLGFKLAEKPADTDHPYGHARYEYISGLAVAAMILFIGFELGKSSVEKIIHPAGVDFTWITAAVLLGSMAVKLWLSLFNRRLGKKIGSETLMATAADSRNDVLATAAVLASGLVEKFTGWHIDGYMGLAVAIFILYSGIGLARDTISPLLGEAAGPELREQNLDKIRSEQRVLGYHDLMVNLERECLQSHGIHLVIHYDPVVTDDPELDRMKHVTAEALHRIDPRLSIHDFRMVQGNGHTNLIFDMSIPEELMSKKVEIKAELDRILNHDAPCTYYTVITFDLASFNQ